MSKAAGSFYLDVECHGIHNNGMSFGVVALVVIAARRFHFNIQGLKGVQIDIISDDIHQKAIDLADDIDLTVRDKLRSLVARRNLWAFSQLGGSSGIAAKLHTGLHVGIGSTNLDDIHNELALRKHAFGQNTYPRPHQKGFLKFLWDACQDLTLCILMLCAILSLGFGIKSDGWKDGWYDGVSISFAVLLVIIVSSLSNYRQARQFVKLNDEKDNIQVQVVRCGRRTFVSIFDLVVGDVVELHTGDQIPADGLFIDGHSLSIDESSVTGEAEAFIPHPTNCPFLMSGCKVNDGYGTMLITAVGIDTEWGKTMATISTDKNEETPLQKRLTSVAGLIGYVGLTIALLVLIILVVFYFTGHSNDSSSSSEKFQAGKTTASNVVNSIVHIFAIAVTIVVVAVPEGLPLAVTLTLAYSMHKMMADKALVRKLAACEIMGSATTICSDKTGTITLNQMTVIQSWTAGLHRTSSVGAPMHSKVCELLFEALAHNTAGSVFIPATSFGLEKAEVSGSPTEKALLWWGLEMGLPFDEVKAKALAFKVETFNSEKKRAGVAVRRRDDARVIVHWKGAAEIILSACSRWVDDEGMLKEMTMENRKGLEGLIQEMAAASLRCVAFAYHECGVFNPDKAWELPDVGLALLAIAGMKDPCRPGVKKAVEKVKKAGVKVRMVTGDNLATAKAIAKECTILESDDDMAVEGSTFRNWDESERREKLPHMAVLARALPSDKLLLVQTLQSMGDVVAVTGDGINDAPALHEANVGLSMGVEGTEVAKESSDIIILDDDFASIVKVVKWGRSINSNIQKFLQFQLTVNVVALTVNFIAAITSGDVPLTAVQLLWVNLIMDTLGALALATEPPTEELMSRPPVLQDEPLISNTMWRNLVLQATYQVALLLTLQFHGETILHLSGTHATLTNRTIIFNSFVLCQLFNEVNSRKPEQKNIFRGLFGNPLFISIVGITLVLQVVMVEFLEKFAATLQLNWNQWLICIGLASLSWPIALVGKFIPVPETPIGSSIRNLWKKLFMSAARR